MADHSVLRVMRELQQLDETDQLAYTVTYKESNIREISALILGPPETPYAFGFYQFAISIPNDYPRRPPAVILKTTNRGRTRFGPNLYANGKVCLSILGTWAGERGEEWSPAQGLESVLISIQSLLSRNPYYNEPGFEESNTGRHDLETVQLYSDKIKHENIRLSVLAPLERAMGINSDSQDEANLWDGGSEEAHSNPFIDFCKQRFMWYRDHYKQVIKDGIKKQGNLPNREFPVMSFESCSNEMIGKWDYLDLEKRTTRLEDRLLREIQGWPSAGLALAKDDFGLAFNLRAQHEQLVSELKCRTDTHFDLSLVDDNPFLWLITVLGRPMTRFEGGVFRIKVYISPEHPIVQPRVFVETPIFHVRVSLDNMLIYLPARADEMVRHVEGIFNSLEEESPPFNPMMTVHQEASKLCWGSEQERREYLRRFRRSVADSADLF